MLICTNLKFKYIFLSERKLKIADKKRLTDCTQELQQTTYPSLARQVQNLASLVPCIRVFQTSSEQPEMSSVSN